jgi:hypothetical protein
MIEIEIKTSKADLNNDFKKPKHRIYETKQGPWVPHQFYFAVPEELVEYALTKCVGKPYGVIKILNPESKQRFTAYCALNEKSLERRIKQVEGYGGIELDVDVYEETRYRITYYVEGAVQIKDRAKVIKRAKDLHNNPISGKIVNQVIKRMSSELANLYQRILK